MSSENNVYYGNGFDGDKKKRGGDIFSVCIVVLLLVLLALLVIGLVRGTRQDQAPDLSAVTPKGTLMEETQPEQDKPETAEEPKAREEAAPEEAPEEQEAKEAAEPAEEKAEDDLRGMPVLDGTAPEIPAGTFNPIPEIFEDVSQGVVTVYQYRTVQSLFGIGETLSVYGSGTGFIISTEGYLLTNAHVVEGAEKVTVVISGNEEIEAEVVGADTETDVAVLRIEAEGLHALALGDSDAIRVGEFCLAIGNPISAKRLANTLTLGIISAKNREITLDNYTNEYLQTDAAINFGNSGGPLLDLSGRVIGINSAKTLTAGYDSLGNSISAEGIGFALPINQVRHIMELLITKGHVERPGIGVTIGTISETEAKERNIPQGAYVQSVVKGGPADIAGLKKGDIVTAANEKEIITHEELVSIVKNLIIGDKLYLTVYRDGETISITVDIADKTNMDFNDIVEDGTAEPEQVPEQKLDPGIEEH